MCRISTFESADVAQEMTEKLRTVHPDLAGINISGGGIRGGLAALPFVGKAGKMVSFGYDLTNVTRAALFDGTKTP